MLDKHKSLFKQKGKMLDYHNNNLPKRQKKIKVCEHSKMTDSRYNSAPNPGIHMFDMSKRELQDCFIQLM